MEDDLFYQAMFFTDGYFYPGRYFRTLEGGIDYLREDAKKRETGTWPHLGRLDSRSFDPNHVSMTVAKQYRQDTMTRRRIRVHILTSPEEAPR